MRQSNKCSFMKRQNLSGNPHCEQIELPKRRGMMNGCQYHMSNCPGIRLHVMASQIGTPVKTRMRQLAKAKVILLTQSPYYVLPAYMEKQLVDPGELKQSNEDTQLGNISRRMHFNDQLESGTAGFADQRSGAILTNQLYNYAKVFVDHHSGYTQLYIRTRITSEETVKVKFEAHAETFGVKIKQCHADNGCFQDLAFKKGCEQQEQTMPFCGAMHIF